MHVWLAALLWLPSQAPAADPWRKVEPKSGDFAAEMPVSPQVTNRTVPNPQGPLELTVYHARVDGALYTLQTYRLPQPIPEADRLARLDHDCQVYIAANKGKLVRQERITLDGRPGWALTLEGPATKAPGRVTSRVRYYSAGQASYVLTVLSAPDRPLPEGADRFLKSLKLGQGETPGG